MTTDLPAAVRELIEARKLATEGSWIIRENEESPNTSVTISTDEAERWNIVDTCGCLPGQEQGELNAAFIALAANTIAQYGPQLLEMADQLDRAEKVLRKYADEKSYPTTEIPLGNGQSVTSFGLGHIGPHEAREYFQQKDGNDAG